ncbi:hypothetical protein NDU88_002277 [Pleurodeles waltl]|uniref:Uncharacterized protein n=1 Tax=Pleurodeles waltl TaxID=8319 RepID=A0AAV7M2Y1_PLEWA|nr:hypothetical protein NDU88_002277 [Pleurodeles waltl]
MKCSQVIPDVERALQHGGRPDAVVVHVEGNDLVYHGQKDLSAALITELTAISYLLHPADILWLEITARWRWRALRSGGLGKVQTEIEHIHVKKFAGRIHGVWGSCSQSGNHSLFALKHKSLNDACPNRGTYWANMLVLGRAGSQSRPVGARLQHHTWADASRRWVKKPAKMVHPDWRMTFELANSGTPGMGKSGVHRSPPHKSQQYLERLNT